MAHNNAKISDCWSREPNVHLSLKAPVHSPSPQGLRKRTFGEDYSKGLEILSFRGFLNLELVLSNRHIYHQRKLFPPQDCIDPRPNSNLTHPSHPIGMVLYLGDKLFSFTKTYFHNFTNPRSVRCSLGSPVRVRTAQQISA